MVSFQQDNMKKWGIKTYQAGSHHLLLVWTALVSPWTNAQQSWSGNVMRNRMRSDLLVSTVSTTQSQI